MKNLARAVLGVWLTLAFVEVHAQSMITDRMYTASGRLRGSMLQPLMLYGDNESVDSLLGGGAASPALNGSFAAVAGSKNPLVAGPTSGLATASWYERSPRSMLLMANPPEVLRDMISPVAAGDAINAFGPRVSPVPEPSTYALLLAGLAAVGVMARKRSGRQ